LGCIVGRWSTNESSFSESDLLVARVYLVLGSLQGKAPDVSWHVDGAFYCYPWFWQQEASPLGEAEQVQYLLAQHFGLSPAEQEHYVQQFSGACRERSQRVKGTRNEKLEAFDPFEGLEYDHAQGWH
jgi:hypothetical protein